MTKEELLVSLSQLNEDEQFYQQYHEVCHDSSALQEFLSHYSDDEILRRQLFVPEVAQTFIPTVMSDSDYFQMDTMHSVYISKHNRYTPAFYHWHDFYEMVYVVEGHCTQTIGAEIVEMNAGDICFIAPHTLHMISVFDSSIVLNLLVRQTTFTDLFFNILRNDNVISHFFNQILYDNHYQDYIMFSTNEDRLIKDVILDMNLEFINQKNYTDILLNTMMMTLFIYILRDYEHTIVSSQLHQHNHQDTIKILSYIQDHYRDITLEELARHFHYTVPYCSRLIKKTTGLSYLKILQTIRYEKAKSLLSVTNLTISDISTQVGILSIEHFNRSFRKLFHMTPGEYRSLHHKGS